MDISFILPYFQCYSNNSYLLQTLLFACNHAVILLSVRKIASPEARRFLYQVSVLFTGNKSVLHNSVTCDARVVRASLKRFHKSLDQLPLAPFFFPHSLFGGRTAKVATTTINDRSLAARRFWHAERRVVGLC